MSRRVVLTGLGAMSACGDGAAALWDAARAGRIAQRESGFEDETGRPLRAYRIPDFAPEKYVTQRKSLKVMARDIQLAVAAAGSAMKDAGINGQAGSSAERWGVVVGSGVLNHELDELAQSVSGCIGEDGDLDLKRFGEDGIPGLFPLWLLKYLPNMPACHISILYDLQGPNNTLTAGTSSGLQAVGEALRIIQRGDADLMLAGGAESKLNPVGYAEYKGLRVLSSDGVYRPFDERSNGLALGEGAGFVVLEELSHALSRKARIYAEVVGYGASSGPGRAVSMKAALKDAGLGPDAVGYIQASGTGLPQEDIEELAAYAEVFASHPGVLGIGCAKPVTGFTGFASGPLELIVATRAVFESYLPPVAGLDKPRAMSSTLELVRHGRPASARHALTHVSGFNGQSASLIVRRWEGDAS